MNVCRFIAVLLLRNKNQQNNPLASFAVFHCSKVARLALLGQNFRNSSQITLAGPKIFVWPFGSFLSLFQDRLGLLQELDLTTLSPV